MGVHVKDNIRPKANKYRRRQRRQGEGRSPPGFSPMIL